MNFFVMSALQIDYLFLLLRLRLRVSIIYNKNIKNLLEQIKENAKKCNKRIVLPEGTEERTLKAADILIGEGIAQIILIGNPAEIKA